MVQSARDQQLGMVPLLNEIAQQQRDSDLALKFVLSELQLFEIESHPTAESRHRFVRIMPRSRPQCREGSSLSPSQEWKNRNQLLDAP